MYCKQKGITRIISSSPTLLQKLLHWDKRRAPSLTDYAGSYFTIPSYDDSNMEIEIVFIQSLKQLVTVPYGKFMAKRLVTKLTKPESWYTPTEFTGFEILTASNEATLFTKFLDADLVCIDIETFKENATIRCLSYTAFFTAINTSFSVVLPLDSDYALAIMRKWNWELQAPKIFQNGKYDNAYLTRYNAPVYNYLYDTANFFHCWYSELPKDLGFLNSFFIRKAVYWKDLAETNDLYEYYRYNALDTWGTGNAFLAMLHEAPAYAVQNYLIEFPLTFPCHLSEMTGIARDMDRLELARKQQQEIVDKYSKQLDTILDMPAGHSFNVKSSPNKKALFKILGCGDLKQQDEKSIKKAMYRHPFNARVLRLVLKIIKARTLISNYLTAGKEFYDQDGNNPRYLYSLNPHATDTSRLASKSHHFWCGDNVQKIPRGTIVKQTFKADPGFALCEVDLAQAESRDTAYISGDAQLIENVEHSPDFHCSNASGFFGVPFEELYDVAAGKVLNKDLRQLGKPVNHGANYNMGAYVLIDTMGEENIVKAKQLLGLPRFWSYLQVAQHLLDSFHKLYPGIEGTFYAGVIEEIGKSKMLVSQAVHHHWSQAKGLTTEAPDMLYSYPELVGKAWTRYCFGSPSTNKRHLNAYIAHPPQSLNAQTLNKSYLPVFHDIAIHPKHSPNFKLLAQIHDSILFQHRIGHEYLKDMVVERMQVPVTIRAYDNVIRTFCVPADASESGQYWSELK
jgi:DNA polymerase I-like protein with 3'-5' exonuclease and polymerase domains